MLLSEVAVMEWYEHHAGRHQITHFRRSDNGSAARDDANTIAIQDADSIGVGGIDGNEHTRRCLIELRRLPRFRGCASGRPDGR